MDPQRDGGLPYRFAPLLLLSLAAAVYLRTYGHDYILLDDDLYVRNAEVLKGLSLKGVAWALTAFDAANWHPLTWLSHMADQSLFGTADPGARHLESAALHGANAVLFYLLLAEATAERGKALFAAALFAVHPVHVESVAWVAERKDLLCALFFLLSLHGWLRYTRGGGGRAYGAALVSFALSLSAKPMSVTLPFVLLLLDAWPLGRTPLAAPADGRERTATPYGTLLLEKFPFLLLSAASCALTVAAQSRAIASYFTWLPPGQKAMNALVSYAAYLGHFLLPSGLAVFYPLAPLPEGIPLWKGVAAALLLAALSALALREIRRRPWLPAGWLWFLGTLVPVIGIVRVGGAAMADRYAYLPYLGLYFAAAWGIGELSSLRPAARRILPAAACAAVLLLGAAAFRQAGFWKDTETLFLHARAVTRGSFLLESNLGIYYGMMGRDDLALPHFEESVRLEPEYEDGRFNLGTALLKLGRPKEAVPHLREALKVLQDAKSANRLGEALAAAGEPGEARGYFLMALQIDPSYRAAIENLGRLEGR
jgi:tetratricopeptide (TPR) repeat protein